MKQVMLTGGTGFIGANLAQRLLSNGHDVHLLVRRNCNPWRIQTIRDNVRLHEVDLNNKEDLARVVSAIRPDWVFHLATYGAYSWQTDLDKMIQTNIVSTINLVEASLKAGFEALVNTGSSSEYGFKNHAPCETEWLEPNSLYAVTKASATLFCRYTAESWRVHMPTLRLYSVYGPYEEPARLIPTLITRGLNHGLPPLVDPNTGRDYVYVEDVVDAYLLAATRTGQEFGAVYNVGTGVQTSIREAVDVARRILDIPAEPKFASMPSRHWDTNTWVADNQKIRRELGWQPQNTFEKGFQLTVNWIRNNPSILSAYLQRLGG